MISVDHSSPTHQVQTGILLRELGFPVHRVGYKQICIAVPCYAQDSTQSIIKEIYPYIARICCYSNWCAVEHAIRCAIHDAWRDRDPVIWEKHFPNCKKPPIQQTIHRHIGRVLAIKSPLPFPGGV